MESVHPILMYVCLYIYFVLSWPVFWKFFVNWIDVIPPVVQSQPLDHLLYETNELTYLLTRVEGTESAPSFYRTCHFVFRKVN